MTDKGEKPYRLWYPSKKQISNSSIAVSRKRPFTMFKIASTVKAMYNLQHSMRVKTGLLPSHQQHLQKYTNGTLAKADKPRSASKSIHVCQIELGIDKEVRIQGTWELWQQRLVRYTHACPANAGMSAASSQMSS
eukprot:6469977-Amphidinium_carterae.1